jgi:hypothetical protein
LYRKKRRKGSVVVVLFSTEKFITNIIVSETSCGIYYFLVSMLDHNLCPMIACKSFSYLSKYSTYVWLYSSRLIEETTVSRIHIALLGPALVESIGKYQ